jgi:hypothetical protein
MNNDLSKKIFSALSNHKPNRHVHEANWHLECFAVDKNPLHILLAVASIVEKGRPLDPVMVRNFKYAISLVANPPRRDGKKPPRNTARDLRIIRLARAYHGGEIPDEMENDAVTAISRAMKIRKGNVRTIVTRFRTRYRKPLAGQIPKMLPSWLTGDRRYKKRLVCN